MMIKEADNNNGERGKKLFYKVVLVGAISNKLASEYGTKMYLLKWQNNQ